MHPIAGEEPKNKYQVNTERNVYEEINELINSNKYR